MFRFIFGSFSNVFKGFGRLWDISRGFDDKEVVKIIDKVKDRDIPYFEKTKDGFKVITKYKEKGEENESH